MIKLLMLAKSSFRKNRSSAITLLILMIIATIFLYNGLHVLSNLNSFLDKKHASVNGADFVAFTQEANSDYYSYVAGTMDEVVLYEQEQAIIYYAGSIRNQQLQEKEQNLGFIFLNADTKHELQRLKIIDGEGKMADDSIILPYSLKSSHGYQVGDKVEIKFQSKTEIYTIYGFFEDIFFSTTSNISFYKCYLPDNTFQTLCDNADVSSMSSSISIKLKDGISSGEFEDYLVKRLSAAENYDSGTTINLNYESMKTGTTLTISIIMMVLIFFSALIIIISMVVIRYTVITHIEEDIKNIGSMEAVGFTGKMIQLSLVIEFLLITVIGYVIGIIISILCSGVITNVISSSIGLNWFMKPGLQSMFICFAAMTFLILVLTMKVTGRIIKITPLMALRSGIETYHFGKNYFPLAKAKGNLTFLLGLKQIFNNKKQSISMSIIATIMSFIIVFAISIYYNFVYDDKSLLKLIGIERSDLVIAVYDDSYQAIHDIVTELPGISKTLNYMTTTLNIHYDDKEVSTNSFICNDYDELTLSTIIEGRYPKHDNEMAISRLNQKKLGVEIGSIVKVKSNEETFEFMIVGITQHINNLGRSVSITEEGAKRCSSFIPRTLYLYLDKEAGKATTIKLLEEKLAAFNISVVDMDDIFKSSISSVTQSLSAISITIELITSLIVVLILYFLVKVKLLREKKLLAINKALGFTSGQLILQNVITHGTIILFSSLLGGILAVLTINPLCVIMLSAAGIHNGNFVIPPILIGISLFIMELLTIATTALVSVRIHKVSPRELMTD